MAEKKYKVIIGHAVSDERGRASGGLPGNQNGRELRESDWYAKEGEPWLYCYRPIASKDAEIIAATCEQACANMHIGYNQADRLSFYNEAKKHNFKIFEIKKDCNTDCSALVAACIISAGIKVSADMYTGNEYDQIKKSGKFRILADPMYLVTDQHLRRGDILQKAHHTVTVLKVKYIMRREIKYIKGHVMRGADVRQIQKVLSAEKYMDKVTGNFGKVTSEALTRYQFDHKMEADGIFGRKTAEAMDFAWE